MTTSHPLFSCSVCQKAIGNPHLCFDRRIEKLAVMQHDGKPVTSIHIAQRDTLFMYCSHECWQAHLPDIAAALELKHTYPASSFVSPCCRCGMSVNRTHPYICYSISEMELDGDDVLIGHCLDDHDFAILCRDCEEPDLPAAETIGDSQEHEEATV